MIFRRTGSQAAPFNLPGSDGQRHSLETYRGEWLLLVMHRHLR